MKNKIFKVQLVPTYIPTILGINNENGVNRLYSCEQAVAHEGQFLFFTTKEERKDAGDIILIENVPAIISEVKGANSGYAQCERYKYQIPISNLDQFQKVVATLPLPYSDLAAELSKGTGYPYKKLPLIPPDFLAEYLLSYNRRQPIKEVRLETELYIPKGVPATLVSNWIDIPVVDSKGFVKVVEQPVAAVMGYPSLDNLSPEVATQFNNQLNAITKPAMTFEEFQRFNRIYGETVMGVALDITEDSPYKSGEPYERELFRRIKEKMIVPSFQK